MTIQSWVGVLIIIMGLIWNNDICCKYAHGDNNAHKYKRAKIDDSKNTYRCLYQIMEITCKYFTKILSYSLLKNDAR